MSIDLSSFLLFHSVSIANLRKGHSSWVLSCSQRERCIPNNIHITLSMMAHAWLASTKLREQEKKAREPMSLLV
jgi:hypothetical protein